MYPGQECRTCRFWYPEVPEAEVARRGNCLRYPPWPHATERAYGEPRTYAPQTAADFWCGEWATIPEGLSKRRAEG